MGYNSGILTLGIFGTFITIFLLLAGLTDTDTRQNPVFFLFVSLILLVCLVCIGYQALMYIKHNRNNTNPNPTDTDETDPLIV